MRLRRFQLLLITLSIFQYSISYAVNLEFASIEFNDDKISARLQVIDSLPPDLVSYIQKGVPVGFEYEMEIWVSKAGWFDSRKAKSFVKHNLRYDTWEKDYLIISEMPDITIENHLDDYREVSDLVKSTGLLEMELKDTTGQLYMTGRLVIKTMSLSNLKEVESWLKGEISGAKKPDIEEAPDEVGEFLFETALKISGLKNISEKTRTPFFKIVNGKIKYFEDNP